MYSVSWARSLSLASLTERSGWGQSGSMRDHRRDRRRRTSRTGGTGSTPGRWARARTASFSMPVERLAVLGVGHHPVGAALVDDELADARARWPARSGWRWRRCRSPPPACPSRSTLWSQWAECEAGPAKSSRPGMSGQRPTRSRPRRGDDEVGRTCSLVAPSACAGSRSQLAAVVVPRHRRRPRCRSAAGRRGARCRPTRLT